MADKTEKEIAELKEKAPWNQFHSVNYRPVKQTLTLNVTLSPLTNYGEEVDLYDMGDYGSFGEAGYDLGNLTLLDRTSPNTYEVNRFGNYFTRCQLRPRQGEAQRQLRRTQLEHGLTLHD